MNFDPSGGVSFERQERKLLGEEGRGAKEGRFVCQKVGLNNSLFTPTNSMHFRIMAVFLDGNELNSPLV